MKKQDIITGLLVLSVCIAGSFALFKGMKLDHKDRLIQLREQANCREIAQEIAKKRHLTNKVSSTNQHTYGLDTWGNPYGAEIRLSRDKQTIFVFAYSAGRDGILESISNPPKTSDDIIVKIAIPK